MTVRLDPVAVYGKAAGGDGFALRAGPGAVPSAGVVAAAADWLRVFLAASNWGVCAAHRDGDRWWLLRAERDRRPDVAGRDAGFVVVGGLPGDAAADLPAVLFAAAGLEVDQATPPCELRTDPSSPLQTPAAAAAALGLAAGGTVTLGRFDEAAAALAAAGGAARWVAFLPNRRPAALPPGPGLLVTNDLATAGPDVAAVVERHGPTAVLALPLGALPAACPDPAGRLALVRAGLGEPRAAERGLPLPAVLWLTATPADRAAAVAALAPGAVDGWLASPAARADDLPALAGRFLPAHAPAVARLLSGRPTAAVEYLRYFPDDPAGAVGLLGDGRRETWDQLADPAADPPAAAVADLFAALAGSPLVRSLTLPQLGRAVAVGCSAARAPFLAELSGQGVPEDVAAALLDGAPVAPRGAAPALRPAAGWTAPFPPAGWLAAGPGFAADPGWRQWWRDGVSRFARAGQLSADGLTAAGVALADAEVLATAGAPADLIRLVTTTAPITLPPPEPWPAAADEVLAKGLDGGRLLARLTPPLDPALEWLAGRADREPFRAADRFRAALRDGCPADPAWLAAAVGLLPPAELLRQAAAWGTRPPGPARSAALAAVLAAPDLTRGEADWLAALLVRCEPLPPPPPWTAADLTELLPVLDPVRDVVRAVLGRPTRDPAEAPLLARLMDRLTASPPPPPGVFPEAAHAVRPDWVAALAALPGWADAAGPEAAGRYAADVARAAARRWGAALPEPARRLTALFPPEDPG